MLHLYSAFHNTQSTIQSQWGATSTSQLCSTHLGDATAANLHQYVHQTAAKVVKGQERIQQLPPNALPEVILLIL